ncbi:cyclic-di-AMP-binding protein CbpB [Rossellomorea marisflavi]|uniref:cyclic-di-AMP-binding protein CbpB n=1 Tax=Rossellomorea marisflavi TaxID=189381 RepID=UPI00064FE871|nr:cyclic-di-AMP-binding protein CbpB [Rossellomorea marisflavi]KMK96685.1 CBS domain-containing protein YkuL [Rossellomorea marisflavi]
MISLSSKELLETSIKEYIIPSEKVAHVQVGNSLEHALLLLTRSGYSSIPVLDPSFRLHGLISSRLITDHILGLERFEFEKLEERKVENVMSTDLSTISIDSTFKEAFNLLIDQPFLCVVSSEGHFDGIMTRRVVLKELKKHIYQMIHSG